MAVLKGGADHVYLFNYFADEHGLDKLWTPGRYGALLRAMGGIESLDKLPRRHALTFRDTRAPGEPPDAPLPATGKSFAFRLQTGPKPAGRPVELLLELDGPAEKEPPKARVNGVLCPSPKPSDGHAFVYAVPDEALADEAHVIEVEAGGSAAMKIVRVEFSIS